MPRHLGFVLVSWFWLNSLARPCNCACLECVSHQEAGFGDLKFVNVDANRWSATAVAGGGLKQGDPTTLTWSIVPDGTPIVPRRAGELDGPSSLRSFLDDRFGSIDVWRPLFQTVFQRWSDLSGLAYEYEDADDGEPITESGFVPGVRGVRADIRIGGHNFGPSSFFAYNYFPENGDMVVNTAHSSFSNVSSPTLLFRNVVAHEHGHGLGLRHVSSEDGQFLMEFVSTAFDGPQFDDILAVQRAYGDPREKNGGNDSLARATPLGGLSEKMKITVGADALQTRVFPGQKDFVSIDGSSDVDFFSFQVSQPMQASIWLRPAGPVYMQGPDPDEVAGSQETLLDATRLSDLSVELYAPDRKRVLAVSRSAGIGEAELIDSVDLPEPGKYFVRVAGFQDVVQMYRLDIGDLSIVEPGDFDGNGILDVRDLDALTDAVSRADHDTAFDVTDDGLVNAADRLFWVRSLRRTYLGDSNLDGEFTSTDLIVVFRANQYEDTIVHNSTWATGDWDGDYEFTSSDLVAAFKEGGYEQGQRPAVSVPEPGGLVWLVYLTAAVVYRAVIRKK
jgi:hypothetical protein